jgi:hypothetical protein
LVTEVDIVPKNVSYAREPNIINILKSTLGLLTRSKKITSESKNLSLKYEGWGKEKLR